MKDNKRLFEPRENESEEHHKERFTHYGYILPSSSDSNLPPEIINYRFDHDRTGITMEPFKINQQPSE